MKGRGGGAEHKESFLYSTERRRQRMTEGDPMEDNFAPVLFRIFTPNLDTFRTHASSNTMLTVP